MVCCCWRGCAWLWFYRQNLVAYVWLVLDDARGHALTVITGDVPGCLFLYACMQPGMALLHACVMCEHSTCVDAGRSHSQSSRRTGCCSLGLSCINQSSFSQRFLDIVHRPLDKRGNT